VTGQSNVGATDDSLEAPNCIISPWPGVWYEFRIEFQARIDVSTCNQADFDAIMLVYSGTCGSLVCETWGVWTDGCGGSTTRVVYHVLPRTIYIFVNGMFSQVGNFDLTVSVTRIYPPVSGDGVSD